MPSLWPKITRYRTLSACMAALTAAGADPLATDGAAWDGYDAKGNRLHCTQATAMRRARAKGCWGFCVTNLDTQRSRVHVWVSRRATPGRVMELLAHELGHAQAPFPHPDHRAEEVKANAYGAVACMAFALLARVLADPMRKGTAYYARTRRTGR
jgi:hypothetical protein